MQIFDRLEALIEAEDASDLAKEARMLLRQVETDSETLSRLINDFLIDAMTVSFVAEAFGAAAAQPARTLAQKRLSKIKMLAGILVAPF